ncbi:MAG TPA: tyrosine-type recombinase/integrase [Burkholderiaceae bacterium]|nr:tyrosine-type recombinase/integrase [Burkholderiaceae bacterium]
MDSATYDRANRIPWNKGKLIGQKAPFKPKDIWGLRVRLQQAHRLRELALLNLGIDSKLRACDLVSLRVRDIAHGERVANRAIVQQKKTGRPVQFEITAPTREAAEAWIHEAHLHGDDFLFPSRIHNSPHICTRQYARMLRGWLKDIGLDWRDYGTHSMRRYAESRTIPRTVRPAAPSARIGNSRSA